MQPRHYLTLTALNHCRFPVGNFPKHFVRDLLAAGEYAMLSPKQEEWIDRLAFNYRKQLTTLVASGVIRPFATEER